MLDRPSILYCIAVGLIAAALPMKLLVAGLVAQGIVFLWRVCVA